MSEALLPLFPLEVVLFPSSALPLHIFEERYKVLVNQCVAHRQVFGINLVREGVISDVGCTAIVRDVLRTYEDGRMDIVVEGARRFTLLGMMEEGSPYAMGKIRYRTVSRAAPGLVLDTIRKHNKLMGIVYSAGLHQIPEDAEIREPSFLIARKVGLEIAERQMLLEMNTETRRLQWLRNHLRRVLPKVQKAREVEWIVRQDGYL